MLSLADFVDLPHVLESEIDGVQTCVRIPRLGYGPLNIDGTEAQAWRFWEAVLERFPLSEHELVRQAHRALVYRMHKQSVFVVTENVLQTDEVLAAIPAERGDAFSLVRRRVLAQSRPFLGPGIIPVLFEDIIQTSYLIEQLVDIVKKNQNLVPLAVTDKHLFFATGPANESTLRKLHLTGREATTALLARLGVILKRHGGRSQRLGFSADDSFRSEENDGTVAITKHVAEPCQGTFISDDGHVLKGVLRPPLRREIQEQDRTELEAYSNDAQFGRNYHGGNGDFWTFKLFKSERALLNYQAALFGFQDPARFIEIHNDLLDDADYVDRLLGVSSEFRDKANRFGIPLGLLLPTFAPWKTVTNFYVGGVRAVVFGSSLVKQGEIGLLHESYEKLNRHIRYATDDDLLLGQELIVHRDPALPNGSSMHVYRFCGVLEWGTQARKRHDVGVVINPSDPGWKAAGGDFDGDAAVVFAIPRGAILRNIVAPSAAYRLPARRGTQPIAAGADARSAVIEFARVSTDMLAKTINTCKEMAELGTLNEDASALGAAVAQGVLDARKHPVNTGALLDDYDRLLSNAHTQKRSPSISTLLDSMKRAKGEENKLSAWKAIVKQVRSLPEPQPSVQRAFFNRIEKLDKVLDRYKLLGKNKEIPKYLRENARRAVVAQESKQVDEELIRNLREEYLGQTRHFRTSTNSIPLNDPAVFARRKEIEQQIRALYLLNRISGAQLIHSVPQPLAAKLITTKDLELLASQTPSSGEVYLSGHEWHNRIYEASQVTAIDAFEAHLRWILRGCTRVKVEVKSQAQCSTCVNVEARS